MDMIILLQAAAAADSAAVGAVTSFLHSVAPWLSDGVIQWVQTAVAACPALLGVLGIGFVRKLLADASPFVCAYIETHLARWSWAINPVLAAVIAGASTHNGGIGLAAGGLWAIFRDIGKHTVKKDPANLTRAKGAVALLVAFGLALALAGPASAGVPGAKTVGKAVSAARDGAVLSIGAGAEQDFKDRVRAAHGVVGLSCGWQLSNHLGLRVQARRPATERRPMRWEAMTWLTF